MAGFLSLLKACSIIFFLSQCCLSLNDSRRGKLITPDIDDFIKSVIQQWNLTGLAIAVVRKDAVSPAGWLQEFGSYGRAKADGTPVTPDTLFSLASNSKLFTALSTGLLISNETLKQEQGIDLSWSSKAKDVFGETWGLMDQEASRGASLQDMLSHRTGLPRHDGSDIRREGGLTDKIMTLRYLRLSAELRETFQYNNLLYDSLGYLPEILVGQSLGAYVDHHIFQPLEMINSTYSIAKAEKGLMADGFQISGQDLKRGLNGTKKPIIPFYERPKEGLEESISAGSGGAISSARDMAKWVSMLLAFGRHPQQNREIIPMEVVEHAATGSSIVAGRANFPEMSPLLYGAGQYIYSYRGHAVVDHAGNSLGFSSSVSRLPDDNLGIVILNNDWNANSAISAIKWRFIDELVIKAAVPSSSLIDWVSRYKDIDQEHKEVEKVFTPRPDHPLSPTLPFSELVHKAYSHPTYGRLRFCQAGIPAPSSPLDNSWGETFSIAAQDCSKILDSPAVKRILENTDISIPTFIASFESLFTTHIRLSHFSGNVFNATAIWTNSQVRMDEGYGSWDGDTWKDDGDAAWPLVDFLIEWVTEAEEGLALKGGFWGMGEGAREPLGNGKEAAEVWFKGTA